MNIKITYNWLREYLDTDATVYELQSFLSLCGPSVERIEPAGDDYVMDIEITSNRIDMASVFGIAQEAQAILPLFGKRAVLSHNPLSTYTLASLNANESALPFTIQLEDPSLASRLTAIVLQGVRVGPSPEFMKTRLELCDIRSLNNVVDVSNYIMLSLGQPAHVFDYDTIIDHTLIVRAAKPGETVTTLDKKIIKLPGGDIVIQDGSGTLIDLAGIMGGLSSSTTEQTKNVLLFTQTYNKQKIRRTSMTTGARSVAATYFEKGLDEERTAPALAYGAKLLMEHAGGQIGSALYDHYPQPYTPRSLTVNPEEINRVIGAHVEKKQMRDILANLGFGVTEDRNTIAVTIPSYRRHDIEIKEDLAEEVARVYGYHNLANVLPPVVHVKQPREVQTLFTDIHRVKYLLKHLGLHESLNYSMLSRDLIEALDLTTSSHLEITNTISEEIRFLRTTLVPSLIKNVKDNEGKRDRLRFFEIAKTYIPRHGSLPDEEYMMALATNTDFYDMKGIVEAMLREFHIDDIRFEPDAHPYYLPGVQAMLVIREQPIGTFGQLKSIYRDRLGATREIIAGEFKFPAFMEHARVIPSYRPPNPYASIKLDLTIPEGTPFGKIDSIARQNSVLFERVELISIYQGNRTLRFYFAALDRNITEEEAKAELDRIKTHI